MSTLTLDGLVKIEQAGWDSLCNCTGGTFYGDLMTDDGVMILVNGYVMNREAVVASLNEIIEPQLIAIGNMAAALVYKATATRNDKEPFEAIMSSTYTLVAGQPRLALYQQTTATH